MEVTINIDTASVRFKYCDHVPTLQRLLRESCAAERRAIKRLRKARQQRNNLREYIIMSLIASARAALQAKLEEAEAAANGLVGEARTAAEAAVAKIKEALAKLDGEE